MVRIGFDAKRAAQNRTGLGNYSRFIINTLSKYTEGNEYLLYIPSLKKNKFIQPEQNNSKTRIISPKGFWRHIPSVWRSWGITSSIKEDNLTLFHGLSNELPFNIRKANTRSIVTIHDLIFLRFPEYYKFFDRLIYNYKFRKACIDADRIIAVSECTKNDIVRYYGISADKIDVVYQGCDSQFKETVPEERKQALRKKYNLPDRYILYLGSIEDRKNLLLLAKALPYLPQDTRVVAVGKRTPYTGKVEKFLADNSLTERMTFMHGIPFDELPAFYQMAEIFVYPSKFEGFGIPLLEALNCGVPVIAATGSCLEEAGGPDSIYVSPYDEKELADAITRVRNDKDLREHMIEAGKRFASKFEEKTLTDHLIEVYHKVITGH